MIVIFEKFEKFQVSEFYLFEISINNYCQLFSSLDISNNIGVIKFLCSKVDLLNFILKFSFNIFVILNLRDFSASALIRMIYLSFNIIVYCILVRILLLVLCILYCLFYPRCLGFHLKFEI